MADDKVEGDVAVVNEGPYSENENHVPHPTDQFGTFDTSGTAGAAHADLRAVSPIFDVAEAQDIVTAARALDPDDPDVPEHLVVLPSGTKMEVIDHDAVKERIRAKAEAAVSEPVKVGGPSPAQEEAAETEEESGGTKTKKAAAARESQGAGRGQA